MFHCTLIYHPTSNCCCIKMRAFFAIYLLVFFASCEGLKNYLGSEVQNCINCLCHARTGCFSRLNCASYSINFDYWKKANSPVVDANDDPDSESSYKKCMQNENCVVATIAQYIDAIGHMDCNCDGRFDCMDRLAIHLYGEDCANPNVPQKYANRFNRCAQSMTARKMLAQEGFEGCTPEIF